MEEEPCNTRLALAIGGGVDENFDNSTRGRGRQRKLPVRFNLLFPSCAAGEEEDRGEEGGWSSTAEESQGTNKIRLRSSTEEKLGGAADRGDDGEGSARKKLRLTQEQSALLETTFRKHNMLTAMQKQELADRLNLRPRQVEVWFQNRRARTKLKQTEVDCEFLKRCCESLSDENMRLKKELQELRTTCRPAPFNAYPSRGAATVTVCASCQRVVEADGNGEAVDGEAKHGRFHGCIVIKDDSIAC